MHKPETYNPDLRHPELSHAIIGAAFSVHNELGPGWDEWDYHRAMLKALQAGNIKAESHLRTALIHRGDAVDQFELDILVENKIVLELKHIRTDFSDQHYTQIINYLKCWEKDLGIMINFGMERLSYKRIPYTPTAGTISFDGYWNDFEHQYPELAQNIRTAADCILEIQGLGYGASSSQKILSRELAYQALSPEIPQISPRFGDITFDPRPLNYILLADKVLIAATAFRDTTATDAARLKSAMKQLSIPFGILMNFGKSELTLRGVTPQLPHS
jgi:GxxExxY protein